MQLEPALRCFFLFPPTRAGYICPASGSITPTVTMCLAGKPPPPAAAECGGRVCVCASRPRPQPQPQPQPQPPAFTPQCTHKIGCVPHYTPRVTRVALRSPLPPLPRQERLVWRELWRVRPAPLVPGVSWTQRSVRVAVVTALLGSTQAVASECACFATPPPGTWRHCPRQRWARV